MVRVLFMQRCKQAGAENCINRTCLSKGGDLVENMKGQFAFLRLVLLCSKPGKILKDATEMGLVVEARLVSYICQ